ncbi:DinB family protein [Maribacter hydrothermalis]|uniref:Damage-inducible protein DinB n=1 Tax=Maribacter hydrothermalis TaxID=1836467 RepID=A0A1B7ZEL7_9FLAO|nr:DinB family protein [Maribacter hydrothermalis]APQ17518.1 damage-inducible protein DinB [Maribacter hydrothermalis]OBR41993.1 damage-inducible protein DinB [Maribacter hydrothermalis]
MEAFFNKIFDYNFHCNKKLIEQCLALEAVAPNTKRVFSHILNAHHIWNARILNKPSEFEIWQEHEVKDWEEIHYENQRSSFDIVSSAENFDKRIDYENIEGRLFTNTLQDILFHIINHSTNHRGQIAVDFRISGEDPIGFDYVYYKR